MMPIDIRPCAGEREYPELVAIWRSAVDATHDFVRPEHLDRIEQRLPSDYLPNVAIRVAVVDGRLAGFAGVAEECLEMLFVHNDFRGQGVGSALLAGILEEIPGLRLDVNEQNEAAVGFYRARGFVQTGRSDVDGDGLPYPLLHLTAATESR